MGTRAGLAGDLDLEIELKLVCDPAGLPALLDHPALSDLAGAPEERLLSTYFDTPDRALRAHQLALRIRREGRVWIQCLKGAGSYLGGLHQRVEHEARVEGRALDLSKLPVTGAWGELFRGPIDPQALQPCCVTDIRRRRTTVHGENGARIEVALDRGTIRAGRRRSKLCELELELQEGDPVELFRLAHRLVERVPLRVEPLNKAEHGYRLGADAPAVISKAKVPELDSAQDLYSALRASLAECVRHYHGNEAAVLAAEVEGVHQLRVALRRLRACANVFKPFLEPTARNALRLEVGWLNEVLGPIRDWDVFMEGLQPLQRMRQEDKGLQRLLASGRRLRCAHHQELLQRMRSTRYTAFQLMLGEWVLAPPLTADAPRSEAVAVFARKVLKRLHRRLRRDGAQFDELGTDARHRLRIRTKRLRYALQFFGRLYDADRSKRLADALAAVQDSLGALNDLAVVERLMDEAGSGSQALTRALVDGWSLAHAHHQMDHAREAWDGFLAAPRPWKSKG